MDKPFFRVIGRSPESSARLGELSTPHASVPTPVFLPVATQGTVKALTPGDVRAAGLEMVLANMYHLYLRPGIPLIRDFGGLHRFMDWDGPILTDSGGYQVFSLSALRRVTDEGVTFRSHIDGSEHHLTPELAVEYQEALGVDIMMVLDECPPHDASRDRVEEAVGRTHRWADRCLKAWKLRSNSLFAIVQGGAYHDLRRESAEYLASLGFPGYALGGLSLGESKKTMLDTIEVTASFLPEDKPRYLMGVGSPEDIVEGVARGIDIFDCALPTRVARNGALFTPTGRINIRNSVYREMKGPVDAECGCYACRSLSAAYLHHLFNARELLAYRLTTLHNLTFMGRLINRIRASIAGGAFNSFRREFLDIYRPTDESLRIEQKQRWLRKQRHEAT